MGPARIDKRRRIGGFASDITSCKQVALLVMDDALDRSAMPKIVAAEVEFVNISPTLREQLEQRGQVIEAARFADAATSWEAVQWRLVVILVLKIADEPLRILARVRWLMYDAPQELLTPGAEFELMRGMTSPLARGRILSGPLIPADSDSPDLELA